MLWLAEDDCTVAQGAPSRNLDSGLAVYLRLRDLQSGAHAKPDYRDPNAVGSGRDVCEWGTGTPLGAFRSTAKNANTRRDSK
jgi:hypothetical protein